MCGANAASADSCVVVSGSPTPPAASASTSVVSSVSTVPPTGPTPLHSGAMEASLQPAPACAAFDLGDFTRSFVPSAYPTPTVLQSLSLADKVDKLFELFAELRCHMGASTPPPPRPEPAAVLSDVTSGKVAVVQWILHFPTTGHCRP
ncbi:uncharacterized protein IUM83_13135 [Phytophthora cinnamomi]|uniref:uncharacterized protein n=1 Tax=Phytophthora cinnamomi TaxID=4785 RepID=UPI0035595B5E|nr:hypothetical protein IUM83_13135 [Phytophthora cinnamomi]